MPARENKTRPEPRPVADFVATINHPTRRADTEILLDTFARLTGWTAQMWGPTIIGYGRYRYKYNSGREGDSLVTGFSPRKPALSVYIMPGYRDLSEKLNRLGKHKMGKSCLYINKLADVDMAVLEEIVADGVAYVKANYPVRAI